MLKLDYLLVIYIKLFFTTPHLQSAKGCDPIMIWSLNLFSSLYETLMRGQITCLTSIKKRPKKVLINCVTSKNGRNYLKLISTLISPKIYPNYLFVSISLKRLEY